MSDEQPTLPLPRAHPSGTHYHPQRGTPHSRLFSSFQRSRSFLILTQAAQYRSSSLFHPTIIPHRIRFTGRSRISRLGSVHPYSETGLHWESRRRLGWQWSLSSASVCSRMPAPKAMQVSTPS